MARLFSTSGLNMLEGKVFPKVWSFVLPLMITNLLQAFYNAADMIVVSLSNVEGAVGSIGTTAAMINLILNIFIGFSIGANVIVAKHIGSEDMEKTEKAVHTSIVVSLIFGIICMAIGLLISRPVLEAMGDEGHVLNLATTYTVWYFMGVPFMAVANDLIAIFRAKGDTRTPLFVLTGTGLLNIGLNLFFVLVCKMSVEGVAIATSASNAVSAFVLLFLLSKDPGWCHFDYSKAKIDRQTFLDMLYVSIPASVQGALFSLSNMLIQSSIISVNNTLCPGGSAVIDGNSAASSLESFAYTAQNSVYTAAVTFVSQHHGARSYKRISKVMASCYLSTAMIAIACGAILLFFRDPLIHLYISDPLAIESAYTRMFIMLTPYITCAFMETSCGFVRGLGKSLTSTIISLFGSCVFRIIWIYTVFKANPTLNSIYYSYPISWAITALVLFICGSIIRRKYMKKYPEGGM